MEPLEYNIEADYDYADEGTCPTCLGSGYYWDGEEYIQCSECGGCGEIEE